nr:MAG: bacteriocin class II with double-glycine leader peptide [Bacteriophage sp.]
MKKKINKKKVPAYAFGIDQGLEVASILGAGLQGFTEEGSGADIAGSTLGGAAKGTSVGSAILPGIGTAVGGVVGGVGNLVSSIFRKNAINKQKRIKANAKEIAMGKGNAATLEQKYWDDNSLAYTFENGGILPDLAYVDNNEVIRDDFGNIAQVPNSKPGTDNHLIDASNLESVLSDKIKRPGTNKTFAQEGKKLVNMTKGSKGKDRFARNADRLNQINANAMYEQLLTEQEAVKAKKGIKPKVKGIPAYADGKSRKLGKEIPLLSGEAFGIYADALKKFFTEPAKATTTNSAMNEAFDVNSLNQRGGLGSRKYWNSTNSNMTAAPYGEAVPTQGVNPITGETIPVGVNEPIYDSPEVSLPDAAPITKVKSVRKHTPASKPAKATNSLNQAPLLDIEEFNPSLASDPIYAPLLNIEEFNPTLTPDEIKTPSKSSFDFGSLSGLSPILYNWVQSRRRPEVEDQVINPYTGAINRAMASRKLNIEPTLAANRRSRAIARNNMARLNPNTGMNLAYGNQLATGEYAQNASVYANRDNANNQYLGEYANMMNNLGQQYVQNTVLTNDLNARNRAAARNFGATAAGQLGQWSQTKEKMRNQARRDRQILPYLQNFLRYGTVNSLVDSLTV